MHFFSLFTFMTLTHVLIIIGVSIRVIKVRLPVATSLAWLDFEVTLGVYNPDFAERLLSLQNKYIEDAIPVDVQSWQQRSGKERFIENLARLASPLL